MSGKDNEKIYEMEIFMWVTRNIILDTIYILFHFYFFFTSLFLVYHYSKKSGIKNYMIPLAVLCFFVALKETLWSLLPYTKTFASTILVFWIWYSLFYTIQYFSLKLYRHYKPFNKILKILFIVFFILISLLEFYCLYKVDLCIYL